MSKVGEFEREEYAMHNDPAYALRNKPREKEKPNMLIVLLEKFLKWKNLGVYHKSNPIVKLDIQNDDAHYKVNDIPFATVQRWFVEFQKELNEDDTSI